MDRLKRRWFVLGLAFSLCLLSLGLWTMLPNHANEPSPAAERASLNGRPAQPHSPIISELASDTAPSTHPSAVAVGTFRGRIVDAVTREPVREFELKLQRPKANVMQPEAPVQQTFRSGDGRFAWNSAPVGHWSVTATAHGYQRFELRELHIVSGKATREIVLPLRRGHTLKGRVVDEGSGAGIGSASIEFRESHLERFAKDRSSRARATSKEDGSFVLEGVPFGRVTLAVSAPDHAEREVDVVVGEESSGLEIGLSAGGTIAGYLAAADGITPVGGSVDLTYIDQGVGFGRDTGEAGEFSFPHLSVGRYSLTGRARGATVTREIELTHNERLDGIVLALGRGRSVRGVVRGLPPEELKQVFVRLYPEGQDQGFSSDLDDRAAYAMHGVPPGRAQLEAHLSIRRQLRKTVDVPADSDITVDIDFPRGVRLSGHVTRGAKALSGATVRARPADDQEPFRYRTSTSEKGTYEIEGLVTGEYTVRVDDYVSRRVKVSGDTVLDIEVPLTQLAGHVLEEDSAVPVVDAAIHIVRARPGSPSIRLYEESDHFGQFALAGLEPGDFLLTAYKPGYEMLRERITYGSPVADMTIRLRHGSGVEISVHDGRSGRPVREVFMSEQIGDTEGIGMTFHLDENGIGSIPSVLAGSTLSFSVYGYATAVVREWNAQPFDLQLRRH